MWKSSPFGRAVAVRRLRGFSFSLHFRRALAHGLGGAARAKLAEDKAKAENEVLRREAAALREQLEKMRSKEARREERAQQAAQQTAGRSEDAEQKG